MLDLFRPFSYLTVRHASKLPVWVNWVIPAILAAFVSVIVCVFTPKLNVFGAQGLLERLLSFIQTLVGFYIAALAAVSSFNSPHLDRRMPEPAPEMWIKHNGANIWVSSTRRRFMTAMFAFLTAISFLFSVAAIGALTFAPPLAAAVPNIASALKPLGVYAFMFAAAQMTVVTFWGLYYLGERMLTPD